MTDRLVEAINTLFDYSAGTLWFVKEDLIKIRVQKYDQNSTRKGHPAISIRKKPVVGTEKIPMLTGSKTKKGGTFLVKGVFEKKSESWFGNCFLPLMIQDFLHGKPPEKPKSPKEKALNRPYDKMVEKNHIKPKLSEDEQKNFESWLQKRGYK
jgi:hypothetical protein